MRASIVVVYRCFARVRKDVVAQLCQRFVHQVRNPFGDGERCGQSPRVDSRRVHEPGLPPVAANQGVREGSIGRGAARPDAAAAGAELIQREAGQQMACRRVEVASRSRFDS